MIDFNSPLMVTCREISDHATQMAEKARWSGKLPSADYIMVGRRGIAEGIVADYLSAFSSNVAAGADVETAYRKASDELRAAIKRFNDITPWQCQRDGNCGQNTLQDAFWQIQSVEEKIGVTK